MKTNKNTKKFELKYDEKEKVDDIINNTPKANIKLVQSYGKEWYPDWTNMLILGNNLPVLKSFLNDTRIKGKVKLIYIDPPFSTNQEFRHNHERTSTISSSKNDSIAYSDTLLGSDFIEFLRKRIVFLKEILSDDGSIYIHIDQKMGHYLKVIMDEIFGEEHFINDISRIKCNPKNFTRKGYGNVKDMILFYSKSDDFQWNNSFENHTVEDISRLFTKKDKNGRRYTTYPIHAPGVTKNGKTGQEWRGMKPPKGRHWRVSPEELDELDKQGLIEWSKTGNPRRIAYADEQVKRRKLRQDIWKFKDKPNPKYPTEKNMDMLEVIIKASSVPNDIIMDCFCGSGTTLYVAERLNRRWIGIDKSEIAIEVSTQRLLSLKDKKNNLNRFGKFIQI